MIRDNQSGEQLLIDAESEVITIKLTCKHFLQPDLDHHALITTCGQKSLTPNLWLSKQMNLVFLGAYVNNNILGSDSLIHFQLLINIKGDWLIQLA